MTPRQYAAAQKKIQKLYAQKNRAIAPIDRALDRISKAHNKAAVALEKKRERASAPLLKKWRTVADKFDKRIDALARKIP